MDPVRFVILLLSYFKNLTAQHFIIYDKKHLVIPSIYDTFK